jgi:hypothetical protein
VNLTPEQEAAFPAWLLAAGLSLIEIEGIRDLGTPETRWRGLAPIVPAGCRSLDVLCSKALVGRLMDLAEVLNVDEGVLVTIAIRRALRAFERQEES